MTESEDAWKGSNNHTSAQKDPGEWYRDRTGTAKNKSTHWAFWCIMTGSSSLPGLFDEAEVTLLKEKDTKQITTKN